MLWEIRYLNLGPWTTPLGRIQTHRNFGDLPDHFNIFGISKHLWLALGRRMRLQDHAVVAKAAPGACIAAAKLQEVDRAVELVVPPAVYDRAAYRRRSLPGNLAQLWDT